MLTGNPTEPKKLQTSNTTGPQDTTGHNTVHPNLILHTVLQVPQNKRPRHYKSTQGYTRLHRDTQGYTRLHKATQRHIKQITHSPVQTTDCTQGTTQNTQDTQRKKGSKSYSNNRLTSNNGH